MSASQIRDAVNRAKPVRMPIAQVAAELYRKPTSALKWSWAEDIDGGESADELVEGLITRTALSVLYGDSNTAKTFIAIDVGAAVARGITWMQRRTEQGLVVYLATESPKSVKTRLHAYQKHFEGKVPNFVIVESPLDLFNGNGDTQAAIDLVHEIEARAGKRCELIVGDTLARLAAGANENSGEDMSVVIKHIDRIRAQTSAHFMLVHHSGKDAAKGMRGWSGLRAAVDTELEITADEATGLRNIEITKQRDIPGKGTRIGFRLLVVELGKTKWGKPFTSCVVEPADAAPKPVKGKRVSEIAGAIIEFLKHSAGPVKKSEVVKHFADTYERGPVYREIAKISDSGRIANDGGLLSLRSAFIIEGAK